MLQSVEHYFFDADYHDLLDSLFNTGEFDAFGKPMRSFKDGRPGGIMRDCYISERTCVGHTTCLVATVSVEMGKDYLPLERIPFTDEDGHVWSRNDPLYCFGMAITLDQERKGECKASLWLETDPREWLRPRMAPTIVDLEHQQKPAAKVPRWLSPVPGNRAIEYSKTVWREIIGEINEYLKELDEREAQDRSMAMEPGDTKGITEASPACVRWRQDVRQYLNTLSDGTDPTLEGLATKMSLVYDTIRQRSSEHKQCCFDWLRVKHARRIPD